MDDEQGHDAAIQQSEDDAWEKTLQRRRETAYKTIGVNINVEWKFPSDENMTPEQAEGFARDRPRWTQSVCFDMELEAAQTTTQRDSVTHGEPATWGITRRSTTWVTFRLLLVSMIW
jgi:hypothetical protein